MDKRAPHLKRLFDPNKGALGDYVSLFIDYVLKDDRFARSVRRRKTVGAWPNLSSADFERSELRRLLDYQYPKGYNRPDAPKIWSLNFPYVSRVWLGLFLNGEIGNILNDMRRHCFRGIKASPFQMQPSRSKHNPGLSKLSDRAFSESAEAFIKEAHQNNVFGSSPEQHVHEVITTLRQAMNWACVWSESPDDILVYMRGMMTSSIIHPFLKRPISPLEMSGYGNLSDIGQLIKKMPLMLDDQRIIRRPDVEGGMVHPEFIDIWFDRKLDIGGCPALLHRSIAGDVYNEAARMWIECAEVLIDYHNEVTYGVDSAAKLQADARDLTRS